MKTTLSLLALFMLVLGGGYLLSSRNSVSKAPVTAAVTPEATTSVPTNAQPTPPASTPPVQKGPTSYTAAVVASHGTVQSCWTSISGNVYDLTQWISQHPGGEGPILSICGKDGTQAFQMQHGRPGDTRPQQMLATFKIGTLAS